MGFFGRKRKQSLDAIDQLLANAPAAWSLDETAAGELEQLLAVPSETAPQKPAPEDWQECLLRAVDHHAAAASYRSRVVVKSLDPHDQSTLEWQFEHVRPDKLHVLQFASEQGEELVDEWIMLGDEHYQNAGLWFKPENDMNAEVNKLLLADTVVHVVRTAKPMSEQVVSSPTGPGYLVLDYDEAPSVFVEFFAGDREPAETGGRTRVWVDMTNDTLARIDATTEGQEVSQGYTSYGAAIEIEAPGVLAEIEP